MGNLCHLFITTKTMCAHYSQPVRIRKTHKNYKRYVGKCMKREKITQYQYGKTKQLGHFDKFHMFPFVI